MPENKDERTEELPVSETVTWNHEEDTETHMTPIDADEDGYEETEIDIPMSKKKPNKSQKTKITWIIILICLILFVGIGGFLVIRNYQVEKEKKQEAYDKVYDQLKITFKEEDTDSEGNKYDPTVIEYGEEASGPENLVDTHYGDLTYEPQTIDTSKVGTVTIVYTVSIEDEYDELVSRQFTLNVTIEDTQAPVITCDEEEVTITEGDAFDAKDHIQSVKDAVDGDLQYVEEEPEKNSESAPLYETGWYTVTSDVDASAPGSYSVEIHACDINGNTSDSSYSVTVKKKDPTYYMHIATYTLTQKDVSLNGTSLSSGTTSSESTGLGTDDWENVGSYLAKELYESDQYDSEDAMMEDGESYLSNHFTELVKNKSGNSESALGVSVTERSVSVYYMAALDEDGNVMYYFYAIV